MVRTLCAHVYVHLKWHTLKTTELLLETYRYAYQKGTFTQVKLPAVHKNEDHAGLREPAFTEDFAKEARN